MTGFKLIRRDKCTMCGVSRSKWDALMAIADKMKSISGLVEHMWLAIDKGKNCDEYRINAAMLEHLHHSIKDSLARLEALPPVGETK